MIIFSVLDEKKSNKGGRGKTLMKTLDHFQRLNKLMRPIK